MDGDFIERLQQINLTEDKEEVCQVRATRRKEILEECFLSLLGRFLTTRQYNQQVAKAMLRTVWKMGSDLRIIDVGDGLFQFKFNLESQLKWVMNNGPWCFDNYPLALRRWERGMTAASVKFHLLPIWIQVWGLPFDLITEETGRDIGEWIGRVVDVDTTAFTSEQARLIRIRVEIPLDRPIRRGGIISSPEGDKIRIGFKYKRLVGLCFHCGLFGHEAKECKKPRDPTQQELPYGEWLKAGYQGREESNTKKGGMSRQTQQQVVSPEKPNGDGKRIQTEDPSNGVLNVGFCNSQNVANVGNINTPELNDMETLMSGLSGEKISSRISQTENVITGGVNSVHGDINTNSTTNLVSIPVVYVGSKDTPSATIKTPHEHSPNQGKKIITREEGGSTWRRLERTQSRTTTNPKDSTSCGSKRRVLYHEAETKKTNPKGKRSKTLVAANVDQV
ncbi:hypothetical protein SO802_029301 [Lithocarpus litseifolius]|uniref:CCHC-type domain-containing protein n=1 Tax=Lithocarpus litseifolius TaxID=425828 RepID=A0AAW2BUZ6_9ROSI